ncbi:uncharacterized protein LOC122236194 [Panthera tigris]|uniref:uncharacterized protein LOC122236194 n=1 Tax=Panthera tigris TaxID=9694 RepID=UPI001C6F83E0|nr:uncharacterized protein LOC122236194 [Panthera tigris]
MDYQDWDSENQVMINCQNRDRMGSKHPNDSFVQMLTVGRRVWGTSLNYSKRLCPMRWFRARGEAARAAITSQPPCEGHLSQPLCFLQELRPATPLPGTEVEEEGAAKWLENKPESVYPPAASLEKKEKQEGRLTALITTGWSPDVAEEGYQRTHTLEGGCDQLPGQSPSLEAPDRNCPLGPREDLGNYHVSPQSLLEEERAGLESDTITIIT